MLAVGLNPFRAGRCLSTWAYFERLADNKGLNPFRAGRCLSTKTLLAVTLVATVSIPFEQGDVFRPKKSIGDLS